jgi:hypothetical protein
MLLLIALLFAHACTFHVAEAVSWCDDTPAFGDYTLAANDVCTLTTQIKVTNGNTLSIIGEETESSTDLALITQNEVADNDAHRLFWVEWGELRLAWVRLTGGRVRWDHYTAPRTYHPPGTGDLLVGGGLVYVGDGSRTNEKGSAMMNATTGVIFQGGRSFLGGGIYAFGSESVVWMGSGCKVIEN